MPPLRLSAYTTTTAAGPGKAALWQAFAHHRSGLRANDLAHCALGTWIGRVADVEEAPLPAAQQIWDCRNNRLAWLGLNQDGFFEQAQAIVGKYGASRVALVLGTSTSSMASTEDAYRKYRGQGAFASEDVRPQVHSPHSLVGFVAEALGITGPQFTVATACSSSARVFGSAERLMRAGLADAAVVGGVDSLCQSVMYGFHALELMSADPCRPFDRARNGLNIGEAAGFALLERVESTQQGMLFTGYGESSDAHHMSSPHPEGLGARLSMQAALQRAGLDATQIDYINLHGTSTRMNDTVEAQAVAAEFKQPVACSSTKGYTGHTLGAAGIVEAVATLLALEQQSVPGSYNCTDPEPLMRDYLRPRTAPAALRHALSNSFGFGGNNCSLLFTRAS